MGNSTHPVGVSRNGEQTNTSVEPQTAALATPSRMSPTTVRHGLEDDKDLYERVIERVRTSGQTVPAEAVLGALDECGAGQPGSD